jgi:hypothetical protein
MGLTAPVLADAPQAQTQQQPQAENRDGRWLRAGIREYQRFNEKAANQTLAEANQAVDTVYYIRGVLDAIWSITLKAQVQEMVINTSKNTADPKVKLNPNLVQGMRQDDHFFAPLWNTDFTNAGFQIDQYMQIISNFLDAHPDKWDKHAQDLISDAMVAAFPSKAE